MRANGDARKGGVMAGRPWTVAEDNAIREAAAANADWRRGIVNRYNKRFGDAYERRLAKLAEKIGRSYGAVRTRASRIGARSYRRFTLDD